MPTAIVTGAYGVIGKEIVKGLLREGLDVHLVGRDLARLADLESDLESIDHKLKAHAVDLSSKKQIFELGQEIKSSIDVLINNAATAPVHRMENSEGVETQWSTNVLGYYWMISAFEAHLLKSKQPRVINVASYWAGGLDLADPEFKERRYNNDTAYRQSKQADRMLSYGLAEKYNGRISINACHPGDANSKLSNDLGFGGSESAVQAASTPLYLALTEAGVESTGCYFEHHRESACRFKEQKSEIAALMELCESY